MVVSICLVYFKYQILLWIYRNMIDFWIFTLDLASLKTLCRDILSIIYDILLTSECHVKAYWVKVLTIKLDNLNSATGNHMVERQSQLWQICPKNCMYVAWLMVIEMCVYTHTINKHEKCYGQIVVFLSFQFVYLKFLLPPYTSQKHSPCKHSVHHKIIQYSFIMSS